MSKNHDQKTRERRRRALVGRRVLRDRWGEPVEALSAEGPQGRAGVRRWVARLMTSPANATPTARDRAALAEQLARLYAERGAMHYGEGVSQREHALQAALLAREAGASSALVTAALLHDIGHLLDKRGEDAAARGVDTRHEAIGAAWLARHFGLEVCAPIRLHVAAKRYLCAVEPGYRELLSPASVLSASLQGGAMTAREAEAFEAEPFSAGAVRLRRWDEAAKRVGLATPPFEAFIPDILAAPAA